MHKLDSFPVALQTDLALPRSHLQAALLLALLFLEFASTSAFYYPAALAEGAHITGFFIADKVGNSVKYCPVSDLSSCEVVINASRLGLNEGFYPGKVVIERVAGENRALIVCARDGKGRSWRCPYGTQEPCTLITNAFRDSPGVDVVMENGKVKGYVVAAVDAVAFCELDSAGNVSNTTGYSCTEGNTDMWGLWSTTVQYAAGGLTPEFYVVTQYMEPHETDSPKGVHQCKPDLSGCEPTYQHNYFGDPKGLTVEYGADGGPAAYLVADGRNKVVWRCPYPGTTCEVLLSEYFNFRTIVDVQVEPAEDGTPAAWFVLDNHAGALLRCPVGVTPEYGCNTLVQGLNSPHGFAIEWATHPAPDLTPARDFEHVEPDESAFAARAFGGITCFFVVQLSLLLSVSFSTLQVQEV